MQSKRLSPFSNDLGNIHAAVPKAVDTIPTNTITAASKSVTAFTASRSMYILSCNEYFITLLALVEVPYVTSIFVTLVGTEYLVTFRQCPAAWAILGVDEKHTTLLIHYTTTLPSRSFPRRWSSEMRSSSESVDLGSSGNPVSTTMP